MESTKTHLKLMSIIMIAILVLQICMPIFVYAVDNLITTDYRISGNYIIGVRAGDTVSKLINDVSSMTGEERQVYNDTSLLEGTVKLKTGMTLKVGNSSYTIVVLGDANGDGENTAADLAYLMDALAQNQTITTAKLKSVDMDNNNDFTAYDITLMCNLLVGLEIPGFDSTTAPEGDIVITPSTTAPAKSVRVTVTWPDDANGLTRQIGVNGTFTNNINEAMVTENGTVVARLVDSSNHVVKSAQLTISNIDNIPPAMFNVGVSHTIANYVKLTGNTNDADRYYFSKDNGTTWVPNNGLTTGEYTFTNVAPSSTLSLRMKGADAVGNEVITNEVTQRTFPTGIDILATKFAGSGMNVDTENGTVSLADGRAYKLVKTSEGSYAISSIGKIDDAVVIGNDITILNNAITELEQNGNKSADEIFAYIRDNNLGSVISEQNIITTEKPTYYNKYFLMTAEDGHHYVEFSEQIAKNGLTASGQYAEQETIDALDAMVAGMNINANTTISSILDAAIAQGLLLSENVYKNTGRFEVENGNVYQVSKEETHVDFKLIGSASDVETMDIADKILDELGKEIANKIIDWAIADGLTTEAKAVRQDGAYEDVNGEYKQIKIDFETGLYETVTSERPEGATITYTLTPDFPTMSKTVTLNVHASYNSPVSKIEVISGTGEVLKSQTFTGNNTPDLSYVIDQNGSYTIKVTAGDGKVSTKTVLVSNISKILPIKVTITPESARNTAKTEAQNGIETGPISVTLQFSEAELLTNTNKYQYKIGDAGQWQSSQENGLAKREAVIEGITENSKIYARYFDGTAGIKQITIDVDNVDNVAPNAFEFTTITTSHSITVNARTTDTAKDSANHPAREAIAGILRYEYSLDGTNWQTSNIFSNLTQNTNYSIHVKAIDHAGNQTLATNNGAHTQTDVVPPATEVISFAFDKTALTNEAVNVTLNVNEQNMKDSSNVVQYQTLRTNETATSLTEEGWNEGVNFDSINNCKIFVRIVDVTGQVNPNGGYAEGAVANIDNISPKDFTPVVTARTQTTLKVSASVADGNATPESLSSGMDKYTYYLIPTSGEVMKIEDISQSVYTFEGLSAGKAYSVRVEAKDKAGNIRTSKQITMGTNAKPGEITEITTTVYGLMSAINYNNPAVPAGFMPLNTDDADWGNDRTAPTGWNKGLVLQDAEGNQFVWVPVDGTNVKYQKWMTTGISNTATTDGTNPVSELEQLNEYKGFYVSRYESVNNGGKIQSFNGLEPLTGVKYETAKSQAESMIDTSSAQSGLITGTQWDTLMKWIANEKGTAYVTTVPSSPWGNYTNNLNYTGSSNAFKVKNIYDLAGNVQEITNELSGDEVIVRGGAYNVPNSSLRNPAGHRSAVAKEIAATYTGYRTVLYVVDRGFISEDGLKIGEINNGPGNVTLNNLPASYYNPVIPVGFKAINTDDATWEGVTPNGWNEGLVIEDLNGNQFVWVPVDGVRIKYEKGKLIWRDGEYTIAGDELPVVLQKTRENEKTQINKYGGFYIARYEAGNDTGKLASKAGLRTVNAIDYNTAKKYAESMYNTIYVKSGLPTGTSWDTLTNWIQKSYGETYVTKNTNTGNNYYNTFTFRGDYAVGPNSVNDVRGDYIVAGQTDVTKPKKASYLLATGLVDKFKAKNIYDLAGNVWEYTTEYTTFQDINVYIARGSDYYRRANDTWGIKVREALTTPPGEARNESGFRTMLFLSETASEVGVYENYHRTMNGKQSAYNNPIIPAGFAAVNVGANWGNGKDVAPQWNDGLVIEDANHNQFVWVPVDKTDVKYEKWTTRGLSYKNTSGDERPTQAVRWNKKEITQVNKYGGFYISRFEISKGDKDSARSVQGTEPWVGLSWAEAKDKAEKMVVRDEVVSGLVTGTQWDTTLRWISNDLGLVAVSDDSTNWGNYSNSNLGRAAKAKNIFEMAGGSWEWTAEYRNNSNTHQAEYVLRGGVKTDAGSSSPSAIRDVYTANSTVTNIGFRTVLYITGKVVDIEKAPVQDTPKLKGTTFNAAVNAPVLTEGMTPVKWNGKTWVKTKATDPDWYNYVDAEASGITNLEQHNTSRWANVMMPDGTILVWIPRYAYKITYNDPNNIKQGGKIDVVFLHGTSDTPQKDVKVNHQLKDGVTLTNSYIVHPAFINSAKLGGWDRELEGIWVAKNERGSSDDKQGSRQYNEAREILFGLNKTNPDITVDNRPFDTHMAKNTEWGAVAYLAVSTYGSGSSSSATTTGNKYGVEDMNGGLMEYTASYLQGILPGRVSNIFSIITSPSKYKQIYTNIYTKNKGNGRWWESQKVGTFYYGDAFTDTASWDGADNQDPNDYYTVHKWYNHYTPRPLFVRGTDGQWSHGNYNLYATSVQCANTNFSYAYRLVVIPNDTNNN